MCKHSLEFFKSRIRFVEVPLIPDQKSFDSYFKYTFGVNDFCEYANAASCYFALQSGERTRSVDTASQCQHFSPYFNNRIISLLYYCLYNGGLKNLCYDDLSYIYFWLCANGIKYYSC